jgi:hypothetical protein
MAKTSRKPEQEMVRRALLPGFAAIGTCFLVGLALRGPSVGVSAGLGASAVLANFAANGAALAWAASESLTAYQLVAFGGFVVRLGILVGILVGLKTLAWFSALAFGLGVLPTAILVLGYELTLWRKGLGSELQVPTNETSEAGRSES